MTMNDLPENASLTLQKLRKTDIKLAVGSSSKNAKLILKKLGLENFFDAVADGTMITHSKPHPEVFIKAADMLGERPYECLVVEDASAGIEAARLGGFMSAGIGDAQNHPQVTYKINRIDDILDIAAG